MEESFEESEEDDDDKAYFRIKKSPSNDLRQRSKSHAALLSPGKQTE